MGKVVGLNPAPLTPPSQAAASLKTPLGIPGCLRTAPQARRVPAFVSRQLCQSSWLRRGRRCFWSTGHIIRGHEGHPGYLLVSAGIVNALDASHKMVCTPCLQVR